MIAIYKVILWFQTNGSFSSKYYYYDFYPSANDGFNSYSNGGSGSGKRSHFSRDGIGEMRCGSKDSDRSSFDDDDDKDKNYINDSVGGPVRDPWCGLVCVGL